MKGISFLLFIVPAALVALLAACPGPGPSGSYITEVFDYRYGPGQHAAQITDGHEEAFIGNTSTTVMLGGWGGYIVGGFAETVVNSDGYDFAVFTQGGTGSEPGVVFVMRDDNGNGEPDDTWYELSGSETDMVYAESLDRYIRNYEVTYSRPVSDTANVTWEDNRGNNGELVCGFPADPDDPDAELFSAAWWMDDWGPELTLTGVKLPDCMEETEAGGFQNIAGRFTEGYAENYGGADLDEVDGREANRFDIDNAVDADGLPVELDGIDFIKVQTGVFQQAGVLNEMSTEVRGAVDLWSLE